MRVLLLAYLFGHNNANASRCYSIVSALASRGYIVDVVGLKKLAPDVSEKVIPNGCTYYSVIDLIKIKYAFKLFYYTIVEFIKVCSSLRGHIRIRSGLLNGAFKTVCKELLGINSYRCIIVGVPPWTLYELLPFLQNYAPVILDASDPLYKNAASDKLLKGNKTSKKVERNAFNIAKKVVVMSEPMISLYKEFNLSDGKYVFIPPSSVSGDSLIIRDYSYSRGHVFSFLYAGMIYPGYRDLNACISAVDGKLQIVFEIITDLHYRGINSTNIRVSGWLKREELYHKFRTSDVLVFVDNFFGYQVPSKITELLAVGKPILFIYDKRNTYLFDKLKDHNGIFFSENNEKMIFETIDRIIKSTHIHVNYKIQPEYKELFMKDAFLKCINEV